MPIISVELSIIHCVKCGVPFGMPAEWQGQRRKYGEDFWCPNGHRNSYTVKRPLEDRQADILKLHMEEQAEARAAEGKPPEVKAEPVAETPEPDEKACPKCGKTYRSETCYRKHLRFVCKVESV